MIAEAGEASAVGGMLVVAELIWSHVLSMGLLRLDRSAVLLEDQRG
jgi:hypothetical protein